MEKLTDEELEVVQDYFLDSDVTSVVWIEAHDDVRIVKQTVEEVIRGVRENKLVSAYFKLKGESMDWWVEALEKSLRGV